MQDFKWLICLMNKLWFELNIFSDSTNFSTFPHTIQTNSNFIKYYITFNLPAICQE